MNVRPITPEMRNILQSLVNNRDHFRRQLLDAEKQFTDYIQQCGQLLGLKDDEIEGFDMTAASFLLKVPPPPPPPESPPEPPAESPVPVAPSPPTLPTASVVEVAHG